MELSLHLDYPGDPRQAADKAAALESAGLDAVRVAEAYGFDNVRERVEAFREAGGTMLNVRPSNGELDAVHASMATWWATELHKRVVDRRLQLHGGYGYLTEYRVARAFTDVRIQTIYGGTTEIMKEIIGRSLLA